MPTIEHVRDNLLLKGLRKPLALNAVDWNIKHANPSASDAEVQHETLEVIRTLVDDGLFRLGDVDHQQFVPSKQPLERSMNNIARRYIKHYEKPTDWMYSAWITLTPKGERVAQSLEEQGVDHFREQSDNDGPAELQHLRAQVAAWRHDGNLLSVA